MAYLAAASFRCLQHFILVIIGSAGSQLSRPWLGVMAGHGLGLVRQTPCREFTGQPSADRLSDDMHMYEVTYLYVYTLLFSFLTPQQNGHFPLSGH